MALTHTGASMRALALLAFLPLLPLKVAAQDSTAAPASPIRVTKGQVSVTCKFGAASAPAIPIAFAFGKNLRSAAAAIPLAMQEAGFVLLQTVTGVYASRPMAQWPDSPEAADYRAFAHPGVVANLVLATGKKDSVVVFGHLDVLCASTPGAKDSTETVALLLASKQLLSRFAAHKSE